MGDLYPRWVGAREVLLYGKNPYGPEVSGEIQTAFYGHVLTADDAARGVVDQQRFVYPIYVVFLLAPTIHMDFSRVYFMAPLILALFTVIGILFCVDLIEWRLPWQGTISLILFTLSSPQIQQGMRHQQLALVVACLLFAGVWCVRKKHLAAAGTLLALATIKPQMALLPLIWLVLWSAGEWRTRWRLPAAVGVTMAALIGAGEFVLPGWLGYFFAGLGAYQKYFPTTSLLRLLLGDTFGNIISGGIITLLLIVGWRNRKEPAHSQRFISVFAAFLISAVVTFPLFTPFNQAMLILPVLLLLRDWKLFPKTARLVFVSLVSWPWIVSVALLLSRPQLSVNRQWPLLPSLLVSFVPLVLPLLLFTRRESSSVSADDQWINTKRA
jgi:MFS family permease